MLHLVMSPELTPFIHNCSAIYAQTVATSPYVHFCLILSATLSVVVVVMGTGLLAASKLASGGKHPILIYVRSQCLADILVGCFGIIKMFHLLYLLVPERINAFLADSLLICALLMSNMTLTLSTFDSLHKMHRRGRKGEFCDKRSAVTVIILLWNGGFVLGFAPQMGWNHQDYSCLFFQYYDQVYLLIFVIIFFTCLMADSIFHVYLTLLLYQFQRQYTRRRQFHLNLPYFVSQITTLRLEFLLQLVFTSPYVIYIAHQCSQLPQQPISDQHNVLLIYFTPILITRSVVSVCMHTQRTTPIRMAVWHIWKTKISQNLPCITSKDQQRVAIETPLSTRRRSRSSSLDSSHGVTQLFSSSVMYSPRIRLPPDVYVIDSIGRRSALSLSAADSDWSGNNTPSENSFTTYGDGLRPDNTFPKDIQIQDIPFSFKKTIKTPIYVTTADITPSQPQHVC